MKKAFLFCFVVLLGPAAFAEETFNLRTLLNKVNFSGSLGSGDSYHNYEVFSAKQETRIVFQHSNIVYIENAKGEIYKPKWPYNQYEKINTGSQADSEEHGRANFQGGKDIFFVTGSLYTDLWRRVRVGVGVNGGINSLAYFQDSNSNNLHPSGPRYYTISPFLKLGFKFINRDKWDILLDLNLGNNHMYDTSMQYQGNDNRGAHGIGITAERRIADYMKVWGKLSSNNIGHIEKLWPQGNQNIRISKKEVGLCLQFGLSWKLPDIPRCSLPGCKIKDKHRHGGKVYRGTFFISSSN